MHLGIGDPEVHDAVVNLLCALDRADALLEVDIERPQLEALEQPLLDRERVVVVRDLRVLRRRRCPLHHADRLVVIPAGECAQTPVSMKARRSQPESLDGKGTHSFRSSISAHSHQISASSSTVAILRRFRGAVEVEADSGSASRSAAVEVGLQVEERREME